jgi:hypothetical protein
VAWVCCRCSVAQPPFDLVSECAQLAGRSARGSLRFLAGILVKLTKRPRGALAHACAS